MYSNTIISIVGERYSHNLQRQRLKEKRMYLLFSHKLMVNYLVRYIGHILRNYMSLITFYFKNISIKLIKALLVDKNSSCCQFFWSY